ncbi:MAG: AzlD domain-containing protein, partial [Firmicutes bacterium]|nr:AzlD domain-containing protein [Bacillota bacterium]
IPEAIAIGVTALLHIWKRNTLLSMGLGTVVYMILVQGIF